jgi:hypothetical protein
VDIISTAYRATDEEPRELDEQERARAEAAYHLLRSTSIVPGTQDDGTIDMAKLSEWVGEARRLLEEVKVAVSISLEWVRMPDGTYFCTICRNGVPLPEPTRYLLFYVHPGYGSTHTVRTYGTISYFFSDRSRGGGY